MIRVGNGSYNIFLTNLKFIDYRILKFNILCLKIMYISWTSKRLLEEGNFNFYKQIINPVLRLRKKRWRIPFLAQINNN